jgi:hypothetical protein
LFHARVSLDGTREGNRPQSTINDAASGTVIKGNADTPLKFNTVPATKGKTAERDRSVRSRNP